MNAGAGAAANPRAGSRGRRIGVYLVLVVAGILLLLTSFAVWVDRVALNTDQFVSTSSDLIADDKIRAAVSQRAVDELYANVDVGAALEERLPEDVQSLAQPTAAGLRQVAPQVLDRALEQPALQRVWSATLEQTHQSLVRVLEGDDEKVVTTQGGVVTLDLRQLILEAADRLGIAEQVNERLPADAGQIVVLRSDQLHAAQNVFQLLKTLAWLLPIFTLLAFLGAIWLAPDRRRALRGIGVTVFVVGILGLVAAKLTGNYVVHALVQERDTRPAASDAWNILTDLMRSTFHWMIVLGVLIFVAAWLAGVGARAVAFRHALAPVLRERVWPYVALAVLAVILLLTGPANDFARLLTIALLVVLGVIWIEVMRRKTIEEFPEASGPAILDDARTRLTALFGSRQQAGTTVVTAAAPPAAPSADVAAQLAQLSQLHGAGALTDAEYASAKARVLTGV